MTHLRFTPQRLNPLPQPRRERRLRQGCLPAPHAAVPTVACAPTWRRALPRPELPTTCGQYLRIGDFLVGEEGDAQLQGHPAIRY